MTFRVEVESDGGWTTHTEWKRLANKLEPLASEDNPSQRRLFCLSG